MPPERRAERWLVTGASGFVGAALARRLEASSDRVWRLSRTAAGPRAIACDLSSGQAGDWAATLEVDAVCHAAGLAHLVPRNAAERDRFFAVNEHGTRRLLRALERAPRLPASFVLVSTVAVYGREHGEEIDERTSRDAREPYGLSKRLAEDAAVEWCERHGVRWSIVRLPLVVGPGAPGNLRAMVEGLRRGAYVGIGPGAARRSVVAVDDVADVLPRLAEKGGAFHLTDGRHPSVREIEEGLTAALGKRPPRRLPLGLARPLAAAGTLFESVSRKRFPFTRRTLSKMTSTLTFCDAKARRELAWSPEDVCAKLPELLRVRT